MLENVDEPYILVVPQGSRKCPWWSDNGRKVVLTAIKQLKYKYNIDSNRITATGFSDGASGCYYLNMADPSSFSQFWPLNGLALVGPSAGKCRLYLDNLKNRPMFCCNTTDDSLYPPASYNPIMEAFKKAGADFIFREFKDIGHTPAYLDQIAEQTSKLWMEKNRNPWRESLSWALSDMRFNRIDWLTINELGRTENEIEFSPTVVTIRERLTLGISADQKYEGEGVKVTEVSEGSNAENAGMKVGDIIFEMDSAAIKDLSDLRKAIASLKENEEFIVKVKRDGQDVELTGIVNELQSRAYLDYKETAGFIQIKREGNKFIVGTKYIKSFSISVRPGVVNFDENVIVEVNGKVVFDAKPTYSKEYILACWQRDADKESLPAGKIDVEVK